MPALELGPVARLGVLHEINKVGTIKGELIYVDSRDAKKHWYIGRTRGERSFSALAAKDMRAAILECQLLIKFEAEDLTEA